MSEFLYRSGTGIDRSLLSGHYDRGVDRVKDRTPLESDYSRRCR
ncbi:hypothetical protein [Parafrankia sp. CH37]|nr:hypothetical protein [Parafrankia sp. CH37]